MIYWFIYFAMLKEFFRRSSKVLFTEWEDVLSNAEMLLEKKRRELTDQFTKNNIISTGYKFPDTPKMIEKVHQKKKEESVFEPIKV